jgi:acetoin utilization deacetylase AcuC-like enzyme
MSSVAFIYDSIFLEHDTGAYHPENANRLRSIIKAIEPLRERLLFVAPKPAALELVTLVHPHSHIKFVEKKCLKEDAIDADTQVSSGSFKAALMAVGAGKAAVDKIISADIKSAFCAVRPPGHHATSTQAMGFCLFNNISITARYAQSMGYEKVMIIDFDVHHGNGTQEIFYADSSVFYFSTHQYPAYPGSGSADECGIGEGEGFTHNFPMPAFSTDNDILPIYEEELPLDVENFKPDLILVSAGYDLHAADPLAQLQVSTHGIKKIVESIMRCSEASKIFFLEGGYNLNALGESVAETLDAMIST